MKHNQGGLLKKRIKDAFAEADLTWKIGFSKSNPLRSQIDSDQMAEATYAKVVTGERPTQLHLAIRLAADVLESEYDKQLDRHPIRMAALFPTGRPSFEKNLIRITVGDYSSVRHISRIDTTTVSNDRTQTLGSPARIDQIAQYWKGFEPLGFAPLLYEEQVKMAQLFGSDNMNQSPFVFYHWEQKHSAIHWVDFLFLRIVQKMQGHGFSGRAIVTESEAPMAATSKIVQRLLQSDPVVYPKVQATLQRQYEEHARANVSRVGVLAGVLEGRKESSKAWIQFMPYHTHIENRTGYAQLLWERDRSKYDHVIGPNPAIKLLTPNILIGGRSAKSEGPVLCVEPRPYPTFQSWLKNAPTHEQAADLLKYFKALDGALPTPTQVTLRLQKDWAECLGRNPQKELKRDVEHLATYLDHWNKMYFAP